MSSDRAEQPLLLPLTPLLVPILAAKELILLAIPLVFAEPVETARTRIVVSKASVLDEMNARIRKRDILFTLFPPLLAGAIEDHPELGCPHRHGNHESSAHQTHSNHPIADDYFRWSRRCGRSRE